jgi:predicted Rossmann-fold nucleotide-binding protein
MIVLVCGGRDYRNYAAVDATLCELNRRHSLTHVIHGGATGADSLAGAWATDCGIQEVVCKANWEVHGRKAGPMRNKAMLDLRPKLVVAFPGGRGTENMISQAEDRLITVLRVPE